MLFAPGIFAGALVVQIISFSTVIRRYGQICERVCRTTNEERMVILSLIMLGYISTWVMILAGCQIVASIVGI